ncbi:MAG: DNRLRE domain-containing protein [Nanoarchaeota archaeon]|nr:DNRLRE domain-containing protein [Nanoarchaeota archaeon]
MAKQIIYRAHGATARGNIYIHYPVSGEWLSPSQLSLDNAWINTGSGGDESVFIYDWKAESNDFEVFSGTGWLEAAADNLFASLLIRPNGWVGDSIIHKPLHFIGHSRGAVLNSLVVKRLGYYFSKIIVDQVTTLDPHPSSFFSDPDITTYTNVKWADNYWRSDLLYEDYDFDGVSVPGARNLQLIESVLDGDGHFIEHSDVHLWYAATILPNSNTVEDLLITDTMQTCWWTRNKAYSAAEETYSGRNKIGYSRVRDASMSVHAGRVDPDEVETVFNGDFEFGDKLRASIPGWGGHGDGGNSGTGHLDGAERYLELDFGDDDYYREHNHIYFPATVEAIAFDLWIATPSLNDVLQFYIASDPVGQPFPLSAQTTDFVRDKRIALDQQYRGGISPFRFQINDVGIVDACIRIDNIRLIDETAPTVEANGATTITTQDFTIIFSFSEIVKAYGDGSFDRTDLILSGLPSVGAQIGLPKLLSNSKWEVSFGNVTHNGILTVALAPTPGNIEDLFGNALPPISWGYVVDISSNLNTRLYATPNPVAQREILNLIAEVEGDVQRVEFYQNADSDKERLNPTTDGLIAIDTNSNDGFAWRGSAEFDQGEQIFFARAQDSLSLWSKEAKVLVTVGPPIASPGADLTAKTPEWDDPDQIDSDGVPEAGEQVQLKLKLQNISVVELNEVRLEITADDSAVELAPAYSYGTMQPNEIDEGRIRMFLNFANSRSVTFTTRATYIKGAKQYYQPFQQFSKTFSVQAGPAFTIDTSKASWNDTDVGCDGDKDGIPESGEFGSLGLCLGNVGSSGSVARTVSVLIDNTTDGLDLGGFHDYPDLPVGQGCYMPLTPFRLSGNRIQPGFEGMVKGDVHIRYSGGETTLLQQDLFLVRPQGWLRLSQESWNFGVKAPGQEASFSLEVTNAGTKAFGINAIRVYDKSRSQVFDTQLSHLALPWVLQPGQMQQVTIILPTAQASDIYREVTFVTNGAGNADNSQCKAPTFIITGKVFYDTPAYQVPPSDRTGVSSDPDCSGTTLVWNNQDNIYAHNATSGVTWDIAIGRPAAKPRISGMTVAWEESGDIWINTVGSTFSATNITATAEEEELVGIHGNWVAYLRTVGRVAQPYEGDGKVNNIYLYNVSQRQSQPLTAFMPNGTNATESVEAGDIGNGVLAWTEAHWQWDGFQMATEDARLIKIELTESSTHSKEPIYNSKTGMPSVNSGRVAYLRNTREEHTIKLPTLKDAWIERRRNGSNTDGENHGTDSDLRVSATSEDPNSIIRTSFINFDFTGPGESLKTPNTSILSAEFYINMTQVGGPGFPYVALKRITGPWNEMTVNGAQYPGHLATDDQGDQHWSQGWNFRQIPSAWVTGLINSTYHGFTIWPRIESSGRVIAPMTFASREYGDPVKHPYLQVTYLTPANDEWFLWGSTLGLSQLTSNATDEPEPTLAGDYIVYKDPKSQAQLLARGIANNVLVSEEKILRIATNSPEAMRADNNLVVWISQGEITYARVGATELSVESGDIEILPEEPIEGEEIAVRLTAYNVGSSQADNVLACLFEGPPKDNNPIAPCQTIGSISKQDNTIVEFGALRLAEGDHQICATLAADDGFSWTACKTIRILDNDSEGPSIDFTITEFEGDQDGLIGDDERVSIAWTITDATGIGDIAISLDGNTLPTIGNKLIIGPLSVGMHALSIVAEDADDTSMSNSKQRTFEVVRSESLSIIHNNEEIAVGSALNLGEFILNGPNQARVLLLRNDGEQVLFLEPVQASLGFRLSGISTTLFPGQLTALTITPTFAQAGTFEDTITFNSSADDSPRTLIILSTVGLGFVRGDSNADNHLNIADSIYILLYRFKSDSIQVRCMDSLDANDSGAIDISDAIYLLNWRFKGEAPPPSPFPMCGVDLTEDGLDCVSFSCD